MTMYPRQDCGENGACWASFRQASYLSSLGAASASAAAASSSAASDDSQKAQQDSDNTSDLNGGSGQISSTIGLESSSTTVSVTAVASETTSFTNTVDTAGSSSTPFPESSSSSISSFGPPSMITQTREPWGGSPYHSSSTSTAAASSITDSSSPSAEAANSEIRKTALIAGVVVPMILLLAGGLLLLVCIRRRRRSAQATSSTAPGLLEKVSHKRLDSDATATGPITTIHEDDGFIAPQRLPNPHLMIPSSQYPSRNPTYFTGLDTFSVHSAATTEDPPPPYRTHSVLSNRSSEPQHFIPLAPLSPISPSSPQQDHEFLSPFSDTHALPPAAVTRSPSTRSFASTLYSSNASVYEARPARRSVVNAYLVPGDSGVSPFADPEDGEVEGERRL